MICPVCKEEMPLLSRICPVCGHVVDGDENHASASESVDALENILYQVKSLPEPSFAKSMGQLSVYMIPILTLIVLVMYVVSNAGLFLIIAALLGIWSIVLIIKKIAGRLGNSHSDKQFAELKNEYEYLARTTQRDYGKNREVARLLSEISEQFDNIESRRKAMSMKNFIVWAVIFAVIIFLASAGGVGVKKQVDENLAVRWQEQLESFKNGEVVNDEHDASLRTEVLELVLAADEIAEAEKFFIDYCMGLVGDMDCATKIVRYYQKQDNIAAAQEFISKCKLRYQSDIKKLENIIK
ncbi:MAG: hypothetical protein J6Q31_06380 [Alistipes sp.]|nr:hypothetical protein [Alistipes sp.]